MVVLVELLDGKRRHEAAGEHTRSGVTRGLVCSVFNKETVNGYMQIIEADGNYKTLAEAKEAGAAVFAYGQFIQNIIDFLIVAFCIFMMIKGMNKLTKKKEEPKPAEPRGCVITASFFMAYGLYGFYEFITSWHQYQVNPYNP